MSDWQRKINLSKERKAFANAEISIQEFASAVCDELNSLRELGIPEIDQEIPKLLEYFDAIAIDESSSEEKLEDEFNYALEMLYNWGDTSLDGKFSGKKVCWIGMF